MGVALPISPFGDDFDFIIVNATGSWHGMVGPDGCGVFLVLPAAYGREKIG